MRFPDSADEGTELKIDYYCIAGLSQHWKSDDGAFLGGPVSGMDVGTRPGTSTQ